MSISGGKLQQELASIGAEVHHGADGLLVVLPNDTCFAVNDAPVGYVVVDDNESDLEPDAPERVLATPATDSDLVAWFLRGAK